MFLLTSWLLKNSSLGLQCSLQGFLEPTRSGLPWHYRYERQRKMALKTKGKKILPVGELLNSKSTFLDREKPRSKEQQHSQAMPNGHRKLKPPWTSFLSCHLILIHLMQQTPTYSFTVPLPGPSAMSSRLTAYHQPNPLALP